MLSRLRDTRIRQQLKKEIPTDSKDWENIYLGSGGAPGVLIGSVVNRELEPIQGKRLSQIAAEQNKEPLEAMFDLILADNGQTGAIYFMMSEADLARGDARSVRQLLHRQRGARDRWAIVGREVASARLGQLSADTWPIRP